MTRAGRGTPPCDPWANAAKSAAPERPEAIAAVPAPGPANGPSGAPAAGDERRSATDTAREIAVVVPAIDEAETIDALIAGILGAAATAHIDVEVVVVDGGSKDGTPERVRAWEGRAAVRLLEINAGGDVASAVLAGANWARADVVVVMDADGSHPAEAFPALARALVANECDVAIGSRYVPCASIAGWPRRRRITSRAAAVPALVLTDVRDPLSGCFAIRRDRLLELGTRARGSRVLLEVLGQGGSGLRAREFPIAFRARAGGGSKASHRIARSYAAQIARLAGVTVHVPDIVRTAVAFAVLAAAATSLLACGWSATEAHFVASVLAATVIGGSRLGRADTRPVTGAGSGLRLAAVLAVALGFGAACLASLLDSGVHPLLAVLPVALAEAGLLGAGVLLFVRPGAAATRDSRLRVAACSVVATSLLLRIALAAPIQLIPQEAYYWQYSQHLALGYHDHPPMIAWLLAAATPLFGHSEFAVRFVAIACWSVALCFIVKLTRHVAGVAAACVAAMLLSILPFFIGAGFVATPDSPLIACWAGALWYLHGALIDGRPRAWWGAGLFVGLGLLAKYPIGLLALAALGFVVLDRQARRWLRRPQPYLGAALALALFTPVVYWNAGNEWASFAFQGWGRFTQHQIDLHGFLGVLLWTLTPLGALALVHGFRAGGPGAGVRRLAATLTLAPLLVFAAASLRGHGRINWPGPCFLAAVPLMSSAIVDAVRTPAGKLRSAIAACLWPTAAAGLALFALVGHVLTLGIPWLGYPSSHAAGWRDLAREIDRIEARTTAAGGDRLVVAGLDRYMLTSELAFYGGRDGDEQDDVFASRNVLGREGLMYDHWAPRESLRGRTILLVGDSPHDVADDRVAPWFDRLGAVEVLRIRCRGVRVGEWFARVGYGYRGSKRTE